MQKRSNPSFMQYPIDATAYAALAAESPGTDFLVISRGVSRELHHDLTKCIVAQKKNNRCALFLTTYGGDPHGGYRVARCLRHYYDNVKVLVPSFCKSAGTMLAIVANELAIGDLGELGPLDIQMTKPTEPSQLGSGLDVMQAMDSCANYAQTVFHNMFRSARKNYRVSAKTAAEFAAAMTSGLLAPLYGQIDPLRLGEMQRAMSITLEYGARLDGHSSNLKEGSLDKLVMAYPAHGFVIDRKEATQLFNKVSAFSDAENAVNQLIWDIVGDQSDEGPYFLVPEISPPGVPHGQVSPDTGPEPAQAGQAADSAAGQ